MLRVCGVSLIELALAATLVALAYSSVRDDAARFRRLPPARLGAPTAGAAISPLMRGVPCGAKAPVWIPSGGGVSGVVVEFRIRSASAAADIQYWRQAVAASRPDIGWVALADETACPTVALHFPIVNFGELAWMAPIVRADAAGEAIATRRTARVLKLLRWRGVGGLDPAALAHAVGATQ